MKSVRLVLALLVLSCIALLIACEGGGGGGAFAEFLCSNGVDDDADTLPDCADPDCLGIAGCPGHEICDNGIDDSDSDLLADCADVQDCANAPNCVANVESICDDGVDNDGDTDIDCADSDCVNQPACSAQAEICNNGIDDDFDFATDCADSDCVGTLACPNPVENCCDHLLAGVQVDEDGDGFANFADSDCDPTNSDGDAIPDVCDNCPNADNPTQADPEPDGVGTTCDNCPTTFNPGQDDVDGDNTGDACDCAPNDGNVYPGAPEDCNLADTDCDGVTPPNEVDNDTDGLAECEGDCNDANANINPNTVWYADTDGDGFGDPAVHVTQCIQPANHVLDNTDCDDTSAAAHPGGTEVCDGVDNDCDGQVDEAGAPVTWYHDGDGDGYGDPGTTTVSCTQPANYVLDHTDCNDSNANIHPNRTEDCSTVADDNCNGQTDEVGADNCTTYYPDSDSDTYGDLNSAGTCRCVAPANTVTDHTDCDDSDANVHPNRTELCSTVYDDNCNGAANEENATGCTTYYTDADGDGFGDVNDTTGHCLCSQPANTSANNTDCNDADANINPNTVWYLDSDGDTYGDPATSETQCVPDANYIADNTDCDDTRSAVHPNRTEDCATVYDDNCNGQADEVNADNCTTFYPDADSDTYGDMSDPGVCRCNAPANTVTDHTDCDDGDAAVNPAATEACNGHDDDCDGQTDEEGATGCTVYYTDADGDGFGDVNDTTGHCLCSQPPLTSTNHTDCNDADAAINPNTIWYHDQDGDTYGTDASATTQCAQPTGGGGTWVLLGGDCRDTGGGAINAHPGATETCATVYDDNCDGTANEEGATGCTVYYTDADNDGYGDQNDTTGHCRCTQPPLTSANNTDCNDGDGAVNPAATETCATAYDDNCNGQINEPGATGGTTYYVDSDGDTFGDVLDPGQTYCSNPGAGYTLDHTDCNDNDAATQAPQTWYKDADGDGYGDNSGTPGSSQVSCTQPTPGAWVLDHTDCKDSGANASVTNPGQAEVCNGRDDDCDTFVDDADGSTTGQPRWYQDADGDTFGNPAVFQDKCTQPAGYVANSSDCNDGSNAIKPGATETCDGADNDCDGLTDDADSPVTGQTTWYQDSDGDGFGNSAVSQQKCTQPVGYVANNTDCNDGNATIHGSTTWYRDADGDGFGDATTTQVACSQPAGYVANNTDCKDTGGGAASIHPGGTEICNDGPADDEDCDGAANCMDVGSCSCAICGGGGKKCHADFSCSTVVPCP